jgi:hypothetical protein
MTFICIDLIKTWNLKIMRVAFFIMIFLVNAVYGQDLAFEGICSSSSSTMNKGAEGLKSAKELPNPVVYAALISKNELLLSNSNVEKKYSGMNNQGELKNNNAWLYSDGFTDITLLALKNDTPILMNIQSKVSPPYFWGPCSLRESESLNYVGTLYVEPSIQRTQGTLTSCGFEFGAYYKDFTYSKGQRYSMSGSFGIRDAGKNGITGYVKLITQKVDSFGKPDGDAEKPNYIYLKTFNGKDTSKNTLFSFDSDTPGGLFSAFKLDSNTTEILMDVINTKNIKIVYNRQKNSLDAEIPIDLTVESVNSNGKPVNGLKSIKAYKKCIDEFTQKTK